MGIGPMRKNVSVYVICLQMIPILMRFDEV